MARRECSRVVCLVLALGAGSLACGPPQNTGRVLLVGVDGATPRLVEAWTEEGWLPHLAALAREGASGPLRSHYPLLSPRIWNSIATGKHPEKHGIDRWVYKDDEGQLHLYRSGDRKAHALWNIASDSGRTVGVVNWLTTHPPEEIRGVMVSDFAIPGEREAHERVAAFDARGLGGAGSGVARSPTGELVHAVHPPEWAARLERISRDPAGTPEVDDPSRFFKEWFKERVAGWLETDLIAYRMAKEIDRQLHPDLLLVYLPGVDRISHLLWSAVEPAERYPEPLHLSVDQRARHLGALRAHYRTVDRLIGGLLEDFGPDDLVLVVSDHGFEPVVDSPIALTGGHESPAAADGIIYARGPGIRPGSRIEDTSVNDVAPTILAWLGLPAARDMDGEPAAFVEVERVPPIPSYDVGRIERSDEQSGDGESIEGSMIEELRSLGYVE